MGASKSKDAARKSPAPVFPPGVVKSFRYLIGPGRRLALAVLVLAVFFAGWFIVWRRVRDRVLSSPDYVLGAEDIQTTPRPEWIRRDVAAEVFRDASLDGPLSIMDEGLAGRLAAAFALHPWVAKVVRVTKSHPARVEVELVWRRPVCMVQMGQDLVPVDAGAIVLPRGDFSPVEAAAYPRLEGIDTAPVGPPGTRWGDGRVMDGAEMAAAFGPLWGELKLDRILAVAPPGGAADEPSYEVFTRGGTRVLWGRGPASKAPSELPAADKVARLRQYAQENGTIEGPRGPQVLDVRTLKAAEPPGRTALRATGEG